MVANAAGWALTEPSVFDGTTHSIYRQLGAEPQSWVDAAMDGLAGLMAGLDQLRLPAYAAIIAGLPGRLPPKLLLLAGQSDVFQNNSRSRWLAGSGGC